MTEAIILAGGLGTRLRSRVSDRPKPMAEVAGRPFLEHLLFYYANQGAKHFVISVGYKGNIIKDHFGDSFKNIAITYVFEDEPLGTGGAILKSFESLKSNEPFLLLNGDTYFEVDLKNMVFFHNKNQSELTVALFTATEPDRFGLVEIDSASTLTSFNNVKAAQNELANGGVYILNPDLLRMKELSVFPISFEETLMKIFLSQKKSMFGYKQETRFIDIGLPKDYEDAQRLKWYL